MLDHTGHDVSRPKTILIAGPTASGKSALAVRLAVRFGGRVINADSMQVYRDLRTLTARPGAAEMGGVPHALYGTVDGAQNHSVSLWLADVASELRTTHAAGEVPILVGGTGLYFKALTQGLSSIPKVPEAVRARMRAWAEGLAPEVLYSELARRDPETARRLRPSDPQRLLRALEVNEATGQSLSGFQARQQPPVLEAGSWKAVALTVDRNTLRKRIDQRLETMVAEGALDEVAALQKRALNPALPVMRAIGVPQFLRHLSGVVPLAEALDAAKAASSQYIKRQETFLRHQLRYFQPIAPGEAEAMLVQLYQSS